MHEIAFHDSRGWGGGGGGLGSSFATGELFWSVTYVFLHVYMAKHREAMCDTPVFQVPG